MSDDDDRRGDIEPTDEERAEIWRHAIGLNIAFWRMRRGLSQQALANRTTTNRAMISKLELGNTKPKAQHLVEIATALSVDMRDIMPEVVVPYDMPHNEAVELLCRRLDYVSKEIGELQELARSLTKKEPIKDPRLFSQRKARFHQAKEIAMMTKTLRLIKSPNDE